MNSWIDLSDQNFTNCAAAGLRKTILLYVSLMLHSIYTTLMSRNQEEPLFNRIEAARNILGISRADLAQMTGVHYQTIGYIERGEYNPSLSLALKLAKALGVEVSEIFSTKPFRKESK